jgi:hypothetical protein
MLFVFFVQCCAVQYVVLYNMLCSQTAGVIETKLFLFAVAAAGRETEQVGKIQERRSRAHDRTV